MKSLKYKYPKCCFLMKLSLLGLPFVPLFCIYLYSDPDMVLYRYKRFDQTNVILNEAFVGWQNYIQNKDSLNYNAFIMGNSCTMAFQTHIWEKYLHPGDKAVRFFDNAESIGGVFQKIQALDSVRADMDHILIVVDRKSLETTTPLNSVSHLFSAEAAGLSNLEFKWLFIQKFLYPTHLFAHIEYLITGKYSERMRGVIYEGGPIREAYTNNFINPREKEIAEKGDSYWKDHAQEFVGRELDAGQEEAPVIFRPQINLLVALRDLCKKRNTALKIIISPDYSQKRINRGDIIRLKQIFGDTAIHDFTGVNEFTMNQHHYYESGHYRPLLGEKLLQRIYEE